MHQRKSLLGEAVSLGKVFSSSHHTYNPTPGWRLPTEPFAVLPNILCRLPVLLQTSCWGCLYLLSGRVGPTGCSHLSAYSAVSSSSWETPPPPYHLLFSLCTLFPLFYRVKKFQQVSCSPVNFQIRIRYWSLCLTNLRGQLTGSPRGFMEAPPCFMD